MAGQDSPQEETVDNELALLTQRFALGDRVRARVDIVDAVTAITIEARDLGTVTEVDAFGCTPLVRVRWDAPRIGEDTVLTFGSSEEPHRDPSSFVTMVSNLEAVRGHRDARVEQLARVLGCPAPAASAEQTSCRAVVRSCYVCRAICGAPR